MHDFCPLEPDFLPSSIDLSRYPLPDLVNPGLPSPESGNTRFLFPNLKSFELYKVF